MEEFELIAKTFQGLEDVLAQELTQLGANNIEIGRRMVSFTGDKVMMYKANFALRTAVRILKPIKHFDAQDPDEVYEAVKAINWEEVMDEDTSFAVDAVVFSTEFRHSQYVAYRVKDAIVDYFREKTGKRPNVKLTNPDLYISIHIAENACTLSLDSSGESLHRRGYRQEAVEAPLNEVLAAGMILMTGWKGECDLIDPMCGSGTIPIEAALIARNIAPGVFRKEFAFEKWKDFDADLFEEIFNDDSEEREFNHHIYGYDIKQQANIIATRNVKAAGLSKDITLDVRDFAEFTQPAEKAIIITNPPYGERISTDDLLGLYEMIGSKLKHEFKGSEAWILSYREECFTKIALKPSTRIPLYNGALECEFRKYEMFDGKYRQFRAEGEHLEKSDRPMHAKFRKPLKENRRNADDKNVEETEVTFWDSKDFGDDDKNERYKELLAKKRYLQKERREFEHSKRDEEREERATRKAEREDRKPRGEKPFHKDNKDRKPFRKDDKPRREGGKPRREGKPTDRRERQEARKKIFGAKKDFKKNDQE
ncbi:MAG: THUMP domain-containing protein [Bacteroidaceae bacterium]|nr:THUMP domain-containing protein [Bacteroidaceae bacterium]